MITGYKVININAGAGVLEVDGTSVGATYDVSVAANYGVKTPVFVVKGSGALAAPVSITNTSPQEGESYKFYYKANVTANTVTFFGTALSTVQATKNLIVEVVRENAAWSVYVSPTATGTGWVETGDIADDAVTNDKLDSTVASEAVNTNVIRDLAITTAKLNNNAVTHAKYQTIADQRVLGNVSGGAAVPSELTPSQLASLSGSVLQSGAGTNSITTLAYNQTASGTHDVNLSRLGVASGGDSFVANTSAIASGSNAAAFNNGQATSSSTFAANGGTASASNATAFGLSTVSGAKSLGAGDVTVSGAGSIGVGDSGTLVSGNSSIGVGEDVTASSTGTAAFGKYPIAARSGQLSTSSGKHNTGAATDYSQFSVIQAFNITNDATATTLFIDGSAERILIPSNSAMMFDLKVFGVQQGGASGTPGDTAAWHLTGVIKNISGTTALLDNLLWCDGTGTWSNIPAQRAQDAAAATWSIAVTADNVNDALDIQVTGQANKDIYWNAVLTVNELRYS